MAEQVLDHPHVDALFEEMRRKAMAQRVGTDGRIETSIAGGLAKSPLHGTRGDRLMGKGTRKEEITLRSPALPIAAQDGQVLLGQHHVTIFVAFGLSHVDDHALAVDVAGCKPDHFGDA